MGYLGENAVRYFGKKTARYYQSMIIPAGTTISNNYSITIPLTYIVGKNTLEVYWNGCKLVRQEGNNDGHYIEYGTAGESSNTIKMYRTNADGNYTLPEDVVLECYVKGVEQS